MLGGAETFANEQSDDDGSGLNGLLRVHFGLKGQVDVVGSGSEAVREDLVAAEGLLVVRRVEIEGQLSRSSYVEDLELGGDVELGLRGSAGRSDRHLGDVGAGSDAVVDGVELDQLAVIDGIEVCFSERLGKQFDSDNLGKVFFKGIGFFFVFFFLI